MNQIYLTHLHGRGVNPARNIVEMEILYYITTFVKVSRSNILASYNTFT